MSQYYTDPTVAAYVKKLREQSSPTHTDSRIAILWERYITGFCSYFGRERAVLVGSTAEKLKLRWSKNGGDTDFLFIAGKVEIPVGCLEFRTETPCFVWIRGKCLQPALKVDLIDGIYLPSAMLQVLGPEAFTILRGFHRIMTATFDGLPGTGTGITTTGVESNVGLAKTEYNGLQLSEDVTSYLDRRAKPPEVSSEATDHKDKPTKGKMKLWDILRLIGKHSGYHGVPWDRDYIYTMYNIVESKMAISNSNRNPELLQYTNDQDLSSDEESTNDTKYANDPNTSSFKSKKMKMWSTLPKRNISKNTQPSKFEVTYFEKSSHDFVPAFQIDGRLGYMDGWRKRDRYWPSPADVEEIYKCELYVVSKLAPVNGNPSKDFCLSFNQAELKLAGCMSPVQRDVMLILKSYLKGTIENYSDKLTTFHLKTALYWVSETNDQDIWLEDKIIEAVRIVLEFIRDRLEGKYMEHYFLPSNLFAGLDGHFSRLINAINNILADPIARIEAFFKLDDGLPVTISLDEKQMQYLVRLKNDGGKMKAVDHVEDALNDFKRGFDEGPKDDNGEPPIYDALIGAGQLYLKVKEEGNAPMTSDDIASVLLSKIGNAVKERNEAHARRSSTQGSTGGVGSGYSDIVQAALGLVAGQSGRQGTSTQSSTGCNLIDTVGKLDIVVDALKDLQCGGDEGPKDANLESPIIEAIAHFGSLYRKDVKEGNARVAPVVDRLSLPVDLPKNVSEIASNFLSQIGNTVRERHEADARRVRASAAESGVGSGDSDIVEAAPGLVTRQSGRRSTRTQGSTGGDLIDILGDYLTGL